MRYSQGTVGRTLVVRFEDGDRLPDALVALCEKEGIERGMCILVGGVEDGGTIIVGPEEGNAEPPVPIPFTFAGVHEIAAVGTIFPGPDGKPSLHCHAALGRQGRTHTGCIRPGIDVWKIVEAGVLEILDNSGRRVRDEASGFSLLEP